MDEKLSWIQIETNSATYKVAHNENNLSILNDWDLTKPMFWEFEFPNIEYAINIKLSTIKAWCIVTFEAREATAAWEKQYEAEEKELYPAWYNEDEPWKQNED